MSKKFTDPLVLKGNLNMTFSEIGIANDMEGIHFQYFRDTPDDLKYNKTIQLGQFVTNTDNLSTSHGRKYFFLVANDIIFPQYVQIQD